MSTVEIILVCAVVLLIASLFLACLYRYTRKIFKTYLPSNVTDFNVLDKYAVGTETVLLGDSLTDFFALHEFAPSLRVVNRGVASETTAQVAARLERVIALSPKRVFLQIGVNDLIKERARKLSAEVLTARIMSIAETLRASGIAVTILSLYPVNRRRTNRSPLCLKHATNARIFAVNDSLRAVCAAQETPFIDMVPALIDDKNNLAAAYTIEGLHLTVQGYEKVYRTLEEYL